MRSPSIIAAGVAAVALAGCVAYPVYQPVPVARMTPAQSAALASRPIDPAERDRYAAANAQVQREDQAAVDAQYAPAYTYAYPPAYPAYTYAYPPAYPAYSYGYYGYPYYGGFYPFYPGVSLSFGFRGGYRGGGWHGGRGGYYGGGGFRGHR